MKKQKKYILILYLTSLLIYPSIFLSNKFDPNGKIENIVIISMITAIIFTSSAVRLYTLENKDEILYRNFHVHIISILLLPLAIFTFNLYFIIFSLTLLIMFNITVYASSLLTKNNTPIDEQRILFKKVFSLPIPLLMVFNLIIREIRVGKSVEKVQTIYLIFYSLLIILFIVQLIFLLKKNTTDNNIENRNGKKDKKHL
ncbi:MAG: hypothetical protein RR561_00310 [Peptostreptococcus sp.]|uniref:hypothetical protein n=1 Tax=Peptostreptococcus sp. TaxID=1262 RepID=UPI002FC9C3DB